MSATNQFESEEMRHIFLNESVPDIGNAGGLLPSSVAGNLYIAFFTQDPGESGAIANEATFTGYARAVVPRNATYWSESNGIVRNVENINLPECTDGSETLTHVAVMKEESGTDMMLYGELDNPAPVSAGAQIQFSPNQLSFEKN